MSTRGLIRRPKNILRAVSKISTGGTGALPYVTQNGFLVALHVDELGNLWTVQGRQRSTWRATSHPAAGVQAAAAAAAGPAQTINVLTAICATLNADAAAQPASIDLQVLDGAAVIWDIKLGPLAIGQHAEIFITGLDIAGTQATILTVQFAVAPAAGNFQTVNIQGYQTIQSV